MAGCGFVTTAVPLATFHEIRCVVGCDALRFAAISPAPGFSASAAAATKPPKECPAAGADITFDDPDIETEVRLKLNKLDKEKNPKITTADLAQVKSLNLAKKPSLEEIDPSTMASRRCGRLFLVGEMLDVDGRIGGFNFQWAWSSGHVAAEGLTRRGL